MGKTNNLASRRPVTPQTPLVYESDDIAVAEFLGQKVNQRTYRRQ